ncbi:MAG: N-acetylmuramoyl-L-alanine amidase [Proteobacteria bacterium]|nr:N-acetylmuramoyl-L-alanine amidase [Pseudomonadota bacterium]
MRARAALLLLLAVGLMGVKRPPGLGDVREVRTWSYPEYTRVVVELTREVEPEVRRLAADRGAARPERLYLDLDGIWVGRRFDDGIAVGDGLLEGVRLGQNTLHKTRVVIDLERYSRHRLLVLRSPDRVVVDVYGSRSGSASNPNLKGSRLSMPLRRIETVVLDPGHGGKDPGAIGVSGLREKDVNLALAKRLRKRLERNGYRVVLTREGDQTLDLEQRTALAESVGGDLFISLHANAARRRQRRGFEIYYLDKNHERHTLNVAARENGVDRDEIDALQHSLARLRVSEASDHSRTLASFVHDAVFAGIPRRYRGLPDLGVKTGPFYVLFLASMPAILVETGFVTNREDARLLRDDRYLDLLADRITKGLDAYRNGGPSVAAGGGG